MRQLQLFVAGSYTSAVLGVCARVRLTASDQDASICEKGLRMPHALNGHRGPRIATFVSSPERREE